ncbi:MAG: hypothetical protein AB7T38_05875 [Nitrospirales bacterium]
MTPPHEPSQKYGAEQWGDFVIDHTHLLPLQLPQSVYSNFDYILNVSSTDQHWKAMAEVIKPQSHICAIVDPKGSVDLNDLNQKGATFSWEFMFMRAMFQARI